MTNNTWIPNSKVSTEAYGYSALNYAFIIFKKASKDLKNPLKFLYTNPPRVLLELGE